MDAHKESRMTLDTCWGCFATTPSDDDSRWPKADRLAGKPCRACQLAAGEGGYSITKRDARRFARYLERDWLDVEIVKYHPHGYRVYATDPRTGIRKHWDALPQFLALPPFP